MLPCEGRYPRSGRGPSGEGAEPQWTAAWPVQGPFASEALAGRSGVSMHLSARGTPAEIRVTEGAWRAAGSGFTGAAPAPWEERNAIPQHAWKRTSTASCPSGPEHHTRGNAPNPALRARRIRTRGVPRRPPFLKAHSQGSATVPRAPLLRQGGAGPPNPRNAIAFWTVHARMDTPSGRPAGRRGDFRRPGDLTRPASRHILQLWLK